MPFEITNSEISSLLAMSARIGSDPMLVQGATGNTSVKLGGVLWVKASGKWLADARVDDMLAPVLHAEALDCVRDGRNISEQNTLAPDRGLKPSIETAMHAVLPQRIVVHTHAVNTVAWSVRRDGPDRIAERLAGLRWQWIRYVPSGIPLALEIEKAVVRSPRTAIFILANHGLVVCGDSCEEAEELLREVEKRLAVRPRKSPPPDFAALMELKNRQGWYIPPNPGLHALGTDTASLTLVSRGILYPCQVIFFGVKDHSKGRLSTPAPFVAIPGRGVLVNETITRAEAAMLAGLEQVAQRIEASAPVRYLSGDEVAHVLGTEAHQYRAVREIDGTRYPSHA